jgi:WD40 repeat protein
MERVRFRWVALLLVALAGEHLRPNPAGAQERHFVEAISDQVGSLAYSPDGQWLAGGCWDHVVRVWDMRTNRLALTTGKLRSPIRNVAFTPDGGSLIATSMDWRVYAYHAETGQELRSWKGGIPFLTAMSVSPDGKSVWVGGLDFDRENKVTNSQVVQRDLSNGELLRELPRDEGTLTALTLSGNGRGLAVGVSARTLKESGIRVHEADSGKSRFSIADEIPYSLAWSPDSGTLASATLKPMPGEEGKPRYVGLVHLRNGATGVLLKSLDGPAFHGKLDALSFSPDGRKLVAAGMGPVREFRDERGSGKRLTSVVTLWDVETGKILWTYEGQQGPTQTLAFSPDGKTIAFSDSGSLRLLDVVTGQWREELMKFTVRAVDKNEAK